MHTVAQVEILQWFVKAGDDVQQFDRLCEVQSDKATVEISSPFVGSIVSLAYPANGEFAHTHKRKKPQLSPRPQRGAHSGGRYSAYGRAAASLRPGRSDELVGSHHNCTR